MVNLHNILKREAGSRVGENTSKLKMAINLFFKFFTGNKFALIHVSMIRMCYKIKTKVYFYNTSCAWLYSKTMQPKNRKLCFQFT